MFEVKAPSRIMPMNGHRTIFMAGSIEMGKAENWQEKFKEAMKSLPVILLNPRRDDWDSSWEQSFGNDKFREQVEWELEHIKSADLVVFYFDPDTMSPITLMELGTRVNTNQSWENTIVCCPHGFWRKGNVDVFCNKENINVVHSLEMLIEAVKDNILT